MTTPTQSRLDATQDVVFRPFECRTRHKKGSNMSKALTNCAELIRTISQLICRRFALSLNVVGVFVLDKPLKLAPSYIENDLTLIISSAKRGVEACVEVQEDN